MKRWVFLAVLLIFLASCAAPQPEGAGINIYNIVNENGFDRLVAERHAADDDATSDRLIALVAAALTAPAVQGAPNISSPPGAVPVGVGMTVERSGLVVELDFGEQMNRLSAARISMITAAAVLSFLEIDGVNYVYVTIDGEPAPPFYDRALTASGFITEDMAKALLR